MNGSRQRLRRARRAGPALGLGPEAVRAIADRNEGIGCDQIIALERRHATPMCSCASGTTWRRGRACGKRGTLRGGAGSRPKAARQGRIETESGYGSTVNADGRVTIEMGAPRFAWYEIRWPSRSTTRGASSSRSPDRRAVLTYAVGGECRQPHWPVSSSTTSRAHSRPRFGPMLEHHPLFPERANISLVQVLGPRGDQVRTWERGAG